MSLITCQDVTLGYDNFKVAEGVSFTLDEGDYLCIVGENGSGKSTLMKTLLGLTAPLAGSIIFGGGLKKTEIGYLPQLTPVQRDFPASVKEIVLSGCQSRIGARPFYSMDERELAYENMRKMGILDFANRSYRELSGGQQQRVLLARALCATRKCLLLDEPVSGLDPKVTAEMYALIEKLNNEGISIIMISHDVEEAMQYASHILHIGKHVFFGTRQEYTGSAVGRTFLGRADNSEPDAATDDKTGGER